MMPDKLIGTKYYEQGRRECRRCLGRCRVENSLGDDVQCPACGGFGYRDYFREVAASNKKALDSVTPNI